MFDLFEPPVIGLRAFGTVSRPQVIHRSGTTTKSAWFPWAPTRWQWPPPDGFAAAYRPVTAAPRGVTA
jgi:hypothetical protein